MKKIIHMFLFVFVLLSVCVGLVNLASAGRTSPFFPVGDLVIVPFGGIPSGDIDLDGTYRLITDANGDSWISSITLDDQIDFYTGGLLRLSVDNTIVTLGVPIAMAGNPLAFDSDSNTFFTGAVDDVLQLQIGGVPKIQYTATGAGYDDDVYQLFGGSDDSSIVFSTSQTNPAMSLGVDTTSRILLIQEKGDEGVDMGHGNMTDPTTFWHASDETDTTKWGSAAHDGVDFVLDTGKGSIRVADNFDLNTNRIIYDTDGDTYRVASVDDNLDSYVGGEHITEQVPGGTINMDSKYQWFGDGGLSGINFNQNQTNKALTMEVDVGSQSLLIIPQGDGATDYGHGAQPNPTTFWHASDQLDVTKWGSVAHDGDDFVLTAGKGGIRVDDHLDLDGTSRIKFDTDGNSYMVAGGDNIISMYLNNQLRVRYLASGISLEDNIVYWMGTSSDAGLLYSAAQTPDAVVMLTSLDSRNFLIVESGDQNTDMGHAQSVDPTIFWHASDHTDTTKWGSAAHNGAAFVLDSGKGETKIDDNLEITGALTIGAYTRHIDIDASAATLGPTAPDAVSLGTFRCLEFNGAGDTVFAEFEVPGDWDGISDMTLNLKGFAENGDVPADTETIVWSAQYRSIATGDAYDDGTAVTIAPIYTQSGAGTDRGGWTATVTIDFNNGDQTLAAGEEFGVVFDYDEGTSTYSGSPSLCEIEIPYTSVRPKEH